MPGNFKNFIQGRIRASLFSTKGRIIVASTGRSGSTLLYDAIVNSYLRKNRFTKSLHLGNYYIKKILSGYIADASEISRLSPLIAKTHSFYSMGCECNNRIVFIFGNALESAISVSYMCKINGNSWGQQHLKHLSSEKNLDDLFMKDILNYEAILKSWMSVPGVFLIHYDDLWRFSAQLSKFIGFKVDLPVRKSRADKEFPAILNKDLFERLQAVEDRARQLSILSHGS